jgi:hypothetical protein
MAGPRTQAQLFTAENARLAAQAWLHSVVRVAAERSGVFYPAVLNARLTGRVGLKVSIAAKRREADGDATGCI